MSEVTIVGREVDTLMLRVGSAKQQFQVSRKSSCLFAECRK